jgi:hypothetical protein
MRYCGVVSTFFLYAQTLGCAFLSSGDRIPTGPDPNAALTEGFFALAAKQKTRPTTVALVSADAEFSRNPILVGAGGIKPPNVKSASNLDPTQLSTKSLS